MAQWPTPIAHSLRERSDRWAALETGGGVDIYRRAWRVVCVNRSKRANHFGTICEKRMAKKRRFKLARCSWHDARFGNGTPVEIKSTMLEHSDGQPGNFKVYKAYHDRLRQAGGWYCFVVYRPHGRSGLTIVRDKMVKAGNLPLLRWHGGGDHRGTKQAKITIESVF